jgi:hypothetical protein
LLEVLKAHWKSGIHSTAVLNTTTVEVLNIIQSVKLNGPEEALNDTKKKFETTLAV